jgi:chromosomal replication initiation ATPase DnaA
VIALLKPSCRFASFVVAPTNQLAVTAARAAAESPGRVYNPLYVYGAPGLGKTHLLMAVGHAVLAIDPSLTVEYLSIEEFGTAWPTAQEAGQGDAYRRHYIEADVLLLDDVHLLAYRRDLQLEILPILDGILEQNHRIDGLDERLVRRFASGLVTDVVASRPETRLEIARRKALERGVTFHPEVLELLAGTQLPDTRQLVAAVDRFREVQTRTRRPLSVDSARGLLRELRIEVSVGPDHDGREEAAGGGGEAEPDEFGEFLSDVTTTVAGQLEAWRSRVAEAILRWEGEGFRTQRLEALLKTDLPADPEAILRSFVADVERLRGLEAEADSMSHDLAGSPMFRDPDQVAAAAALVEHAKQGRHPLPAPSPIWRLEDLVEGAGNQVAVQSAWGVVDKPGAAHNPCVVVGGNGCGKTHLLHGIANKLAAAPGMSVACIGATDMVAELEEAREQGRLTAWRSRYRVATALLIDDIHRWTDQQESAVELVELFEALLHVRAQLVVTSAVPLPSLQLDSRLAARLEGGLVVTLPPPDRGICVRVVERLLAAKLSLVDPQLTSYLASRSVDSVRSLQGLVQRVLNNAEVHGKGPTVAFAREVLEGLPSPPPKRETRLRSSGVVMPVAGGLRSREKMVWHWPDPSDRVLEEWS